ncbi:MAG TPA: hypothetical protein VKZ53_08905 [Candidatus Angelobacter sp.]|nr:hypothetical protein [Candidatus Angelobacter sp.]
MLGTSVLITFGLFVAAMIVLLDRLKFLIPFRNHLFAAYGGYIEAFVLILFLNIFALNFAIFRRFFLKNTGQKLLHLDKQVKTGHSVLANEITEKFEE